MSAEERDERHDLNRDPITDEPGSHPVGTGLGAAGGAAAGASVGAMAGPVGMVLGGAVGAVAGGFAGKAAAERVNPTAEETHWRERYTGEPYYRTGNTFDDYGPAYRLGVTGGTDYEESDWSSIEPRLAAEWQSKRESSRLTWEDARPASRAAWDRVQSQLRESGAGATGAAAMVGKAQSAGDNSGDTADVVDVLKDLVECSRDGEYGFRECAEQARAADLKSVFLKHADECRAAAQELDDLVRQCGGTPEQGGSTMGAMHRGWVAVKSMLGTYDDKAVLNEAERGEDNAKARFRKALDKPLPPHIRQVVQRMNEGVIRNHDEIRTLRDSC
ncbi:MAG: PA2169 family four-helix-bundle protein [Burkholderiales bacterium]|nr:PA2169 family four-helix-bundle protein [Burkholderiales bacterium]